MLWTQIKKKILEEQKSVIVILWLVWWLIYSETWTGILEPLWKLRKDTNGRWLIDNWGNRLVWYWYHHWCNVIEMVMRHNRISSVYIILRESGKMFRIYRNYNLVILNWDIICIDILKCNLYKRERCLNSLNINKIRFFYINNYAIRFLEIFNRLFYRLFLHSFWFSLLRF